MPPHQNIISMHYVIVSTAKQAGFKLLWERIMGDVDREGPGGIAIACGNAGSGRAWLHFPIGLRIRRSC
jgi:hypothetical protein